MRREFQHSRRYVRGPNSQLGVWPVQTDQKEPYKSPISKWSHLTMSGTNTMLYSHLRTREPESSGYLPPGVPSVSNRGVSTNDPASGWSVGDMPKAVCVGHFGAGSSRTAREGLASSGLTCELIRSDTGKVHPVGGSVAKSSNAAARLPFYWAQPFEVEARPRPALISSFW